MSSPVNSSQLNDIPDDGILDHYFDSPLRMDDYDSPLRLNDFDDNAHDGDLPNVDLLLDYESDSEVEPEPSKSTPDDENCSAAGVDDVDGCKSSKPRVNIGSPDLRTGVNKMDSPDLKAKVNNMGSPDLRDHNGRPLPFFPATSIAIASTKATITSSMSGSSSSSVMDMEVDENESPPHRVVASNLEGILAIEKIVDTKEPNQDSEVQILESYDSQGSPDVVYLGTKKGRNARRRVPKKRGPAKGTGGRPPKTKRMDSRTDVQFPQASYLPPDFNAHIPPPSFYPGRHGFVSGLGMGMAPAVPSHRSYTAPRGHGGAPRVRGGFHSLKTERAGASTLNYTRKYLNKGIQLTAIVLKCSKFFEEKQEKIKKRVGFRFGVDSVVHLSDGSGLVVVTKTVSEDCAPDEIARMNLLQFEGARVEATRLDEEDPDILPATVLNLNLK